MLDKNFANFVKRLGRDMRSAYKSVSARKTYGGYTYTVTVSRESIQLYIGGSCYVANPRTGEVGRFYSSDYDGMNEEHKMNYLSISRELITVIDMGISELRMMNEKEMNFD